MATVDEALDRAIQFHQAGNFQAAEELYRQVLQLDCSQPDALHFLGLVFYQTGRPEQALQYLRAALVQMPQNAVFHANLGQVLQGLNITEDAVASFQQALRIRPDFPEAHHNLANVLSALGRLEEAVDCYQQAIHLKPNDATLFHNLGLALAGKGKVEEAIARFGEALRLKPDYASAHNNLAYALTGQGKYEEALAGYRDAIRCQPDFALAHSNLGAAFQIQGRIEEAIAQYRKALSLEPDNAGAHSNLLVALNYEPECQPEALFAEHCRWDALHGQVKPLPPPSNDRDPNRTLRIGYVSVDFRPHAVAPFLIPIITHHDPSQVEVFCYAQIPHPDSATAPFQKFIKGWRSISAQKDAEVAEQIRRDGIDILVDLAGQTGNSRMGVFTYKPAPIQVTYLGYPNTTGLKAMDYRLTDAVADPPGESVHHSEQLVCLPACFCCYWPQQLTPEPGPLPRDRNGYVTLGSLHALAKLNSSVLDQWSTIMQALPNARLLIYRDALRGSPRELFCQQFAQRGIDVGRLDLRHAPAPGKTHWHAYQEIDLSLDPFPWSGHHTGCESLWMGVPVVTLRGNRHAGRMVASVLTCLGLTDWIAETPEDYVKLVVAKAEDRDGLRTLRANLRDRMRASPLCDSVNFTRGLEQAYRAMWKSKG